MVADKNRHFYLDFINLSLLSKGKNYQETLGVFTLIQCEAWGKYYNRSRGKRVFEGSSGKYYGTHGLY